MNVILHSDDINLLSHWQNSLGKESTVFKTDSYYN